MIIKGYQNRCIIETKTGNCEVKKSPFLTMKDIFSQKICAPEIKPFAGGAIGYIAYDAIRYFEKIPGKNPDEMKIPDVYFLLPAEIIVFDHKTGYADIVMYHDDSKRLNVIADVVRKRNLNNFELAKISDNELLSESNLETEMSSDKFYKMVRKAKEYIYAGDIFQVVLSQRFRFKLKKSPLDIYQSLRVTNPSPYMYYLKMKDLVIAGSSPEILVKLLNNTAIIRPLAGTRPRGINRKEDLKLKKELLEDEKERAEHIMLVDLARNDLGRVCEYGSVKVNELMQVEFYSRVMHIVSHVTGRLKRGCDAFDLLSASFPAGTVSGAPKIRAMEIIDELEPIKRGIYAGAIGYFDFSGDMDFCIAIRTLIMKNGIGYIQAGAGIVADSNPKNEFFETLNKISALKKAVEIV